MSYKIEPRVVTHIVQDVQKMLSGRGPNTGEVIVALAEVIGRAIVENSRTPVDGMDMTKVVMGHISRTLDTGYRARGFNLDGGPMQ